MKTGVSTHKAVRCPKCGAVSYVPKGRAGVKRCGPCGELHGQTSAASETAQQLLG